VSGRRPSMTSVNVVVGSSRRSQRRAGARGPPSSEGAAHLAGTRAPHLDVELRCEAVLLGQTFAGKIPGTAPRLGMRSRTAGE